MNGFTDALEQRNLEELRKYPKADLHNHFILRQICTIILCLAEIDGSYIRKLEKKLSH